MSIDCYYFLVAFRRTNANEEMAVPFAPASERAKLTEAPAVQAILFILVFQATVMEEMGGIFRVVTLLKPLRAHLVEE